ncbi:hypothetical protein BpHYR1_004113 [Brachionus plicatilis]|uniref:Uncharacterized protein n=1 Tax=Brachionus plicatilis TaxID=10195 RepID=A0A3M7R0P8_BRAPC|nr:hypothetical protein BpHYR1_004113 [Brachionus plicatilis]
MPVQSSMTSFSSRRVSATNACPGSIRWGKIKIKQMKQSFKYASNGTFWSTVISPAENFEMPFLAFLFMEIIPCLNFIRLPIWRTKNLIDKSNKAKLVSVFVCLEFDDLQDLNNNADFILGLNYEKLLKITQNPKHQIIIN